MRVLTAVFGRVLASAFERAVAWMTDATLATGALKHSGIGQSPPSVDYGLISARAGTAIPDDIAGAGSVISLAAFANLPNARLLLPLYQRTSELDATNCYFATGAAGIVEIAETSAPPPFRTTGAHRRAEKRSN